MKKMIIGALIGFMLSLGVGAHAEVISLINKTVDGMFPVTVDGKPIGDAIVVDNKTYLPVREFGESVGYSVYFTDTREVVMTKNLEAPTSTPTTVNPKTIRLDAIRVEMLKLVPEIQDLQRKVNKEETPYLDEKGNIAYNGKTTIDQATIDTYKKQIADKQAQFDKLKQEKDTLQAQP